VKNIWIVNHYAIDESNRSQKISRVLSSLGNKVNLFCSSYDHFKRFEKEKYKWMVWFKKVKKGSINCILIKTPPYKKNSFMRILNHFMFGFLFLIFGLFKETPDVVIGSIQHFFTGMACLCISKIKKVPFILEVRDFWPKTLIDLKAINEKGIISKILKWVELLLYNKADAIISVLTHGVKYIQSLGIDSNKVYHIPNGIDINYFDEMRQKGDLPYSIKELFDKQKDKFIIVYTGAIGIPNRLDCLIDSIYYLNRMGHDNICCFIVGDGMQKEILEEKTNILNLKNVYFLGYLPYKYIPPILDKANVLIGKLEFREANLYGTSLNKLFDYLAVNKPIIYASKAEIETFRTVRNISFIQGGDHKELSGIIEMLKEKFYQKESMDLNGRDYVEKFHDINKLSIEYDKIIEKVIKKNWL